MTLDTVGTETPACWAIWAIVAVRRGRRTFGPTAGAAMSASVPKVSTHVHANPRGGHWTVGRTLRDEIGKTPLTVHRMVRMVPGRNQSQSSSKLSGSQEELPMWTGGAFSGQR